LEELLIEADLWRMKIGESEGQCNGCDEPDYRKMFLSCSKTLQKELEAIKKLADNSKVNYSPLNRLRQLKWELRDSQTPARIAGIARSASYGSLLTKQYNLVHPW
jgi:hypothetical protein